MEESENSAEADVPRPEELIVEIYRQFREHAEGGKAPTRVLLTPEHYELLQAYRARLGEVPGDFPDYLERYAIFGLEFHAAEVESPTVE